MKNEMSFHCPSNLTRIGMESEWNGILNGIPYNDGIIIRKREVRLLQGYMLHYCQLYHHHILMNPVGGWRRDD